MGKGIALDAKMKIPGVDTVLGKLLAQHGNHVFEIGVYKEARIFSFPTKHHWKDKSDVTLIEQSCKELLDMWLKQPSENKPYVILPKVGCTNGQLDYDKQARPILWRYFGDESRNRHFIICC